MSAVASGAFAIDQLMQLYVATAGFVYHFMITWPKCNDYVPLAQELSAMLSDGFR